MASPTFFHFLEPKTSLPINFDARFTQAKEMARSGVPHSQQLIAFSSQLVQTFTNQRQLLDQAFESIQSGKASFESAEGTINNYLAIVRGLYDYENTGITPDTFLPGHSPIDILRAAIFFFWSGSLCVDGQTAINDAIYEIVSILYNLNACQIREIQKVLDEATQEARDAAEKKAYNLFLKMAGIYEFMEKLLREISTVERVPVDIHPESLEGLKMASLAGAQEMAILRMEAKGGKDEPTAKLCLDTCNKYKLAHSRFAAFSSTAEDHRTRTFALYLGAKVRFYEAQTYMHLGTHYNSKDKNGHAMYCEKKSLALLDLALKEYSSYAKAMKDSKSTRDTKVWKKLIQDAKVLPQQRLDKYQNENERVYHEPISTECPLCDPRGIGDPTEFSLPPKDAMWSPGVYMLFADPTKRRDYVPPPPQPTTVQAQPASKKKDCIVM